MKRILGVWGLLAALAVLGASSPAAGEPAINEVQVQGHHCLIAGPAAIPDDAPVVFILHGLRANAEDLFPLTEVMNLPPCRYILPDAPITLGTHAFGWYDFPTQSREDTVKSRDYLFALMDRFSTEGLKPGHARPVIMMGFSQGGVMSMEAGLNYKGNVLAIVSMSGYIWDPAKTLARPLAPHGLPILLVHGTNDTIVPEDWTLKTVKALKRAGYKPVFKEFPMAHQITQNSLAEVARFLQKALSPK